MWIRSQDKKLLANFSKFYLNCRFEIVGYDETSEEDVHLLGEYESQERGLEVLSDIQDFLVITSAMSKLNIPIDNLPQDENFLKSMFVGLGGSAVYEMPKK